MKKSFNSEYNQQPKKQISDSQIKNTQLKKNARNQAKGKIIPQSYNS